MSSSLPPSGDGTRVPDVHLPSPFDWENLRHYLTFARSQTLNGAARELGVEHATVARRIAALETTLRCKLVDRRQRQYRLTPVGQRVVDIGQRMQQDARAIGKVALAAQHETLTLLSISAPPLLAAHFIAPNLGHLRRQHPAIDVSLLLPDDSLTHASTAPGREPDLVISLQRPEHDEWVAKRIGQVSFGLYGAPAYLAARDTPDEYHYIAFDEALQHSPQQQWLARASGECPIALRARSPEVQAAAARAGLGVALLPNFYASRETQLRRVPSALAELSLNLWLGVHGELRYNAPVRATMAFLSECFASELADSSEA